MIELRRLKRLLAVAVGLVGLVVGLTAVRQVGDAIVRSATGADPTSIFRDVPPPPSDLLDVISWRPDPARDGRELEPTTRRDITDSYARALAALDRAGRGDRTAPLTTYLGGGALDAALAIAYDPRMIESSTVHVRHDLELEYYSDDGSVVAVSVPHVDVARSVGGETDAHLVVASEAWRFVMVLEDGNWRVHQLQVLESVIDTGP